MKKYVVELHSVVKGPKFSVDDIVIDEDSVVNDGRNGWQDTYQPQRRTLEDSVAEAQEFNSIEALKYHIVRAAAGCREWFTTDDFCATDYSVAI